ncbi:hypothetical protein BDY21DRAFT_381168 [Lineolata rhizophorae]|uniref:Uncharacterized protein n=1 Tax=Lineolata rhizophorae TaxID=578093 RepID=A0A6A6NT43_9PEZI|nr:hypothetical protein BDY21DRAFT_381168 [Lineolata rhizophorae]
MTAQKPAPVWEQVLASVRYNWRTSTFSEVEIEHGLHQAAALASMTLLITAHRAIMNTGFTLRQKGLSTDAIISLTIGGLTCIWTTLVIVSALFLDEQPCRHGFQQCAARLAYVPWIIQIVFLFWLIAYTDEILFLRWKNFMRSQDAAASQNHSGSEPSASTRVQPNATATVQEAGSGDVESSVPGPSTKKRSILQLLKKDRFRIWYMDSSQGPFNWAGSLHPVFRWAIYGTVGVAVLVPSYAAIREQLYTIGLLNLVGVVLFTVGAAGANNYPTAPHIYTADTLRVMLHTRHMEGTSYILPCSYRGFDAVWGPKIEAENRALDQAVEKAAEAADSEASLAGRPVNYDAVLAAFKASTQLSRTDVTRLAEWLYEPESQPQMRRLACVRAPGLNLIATNVILSLWHAEYLVFMSLGTLPSRIRKKAALLRGARRTGLDLDQSAGQIGAKPGIEGYREAARYVYRLLGEPVDDGALFPGSNPPASSVVLEPCPDTTEEYFARLWDHCFVKSESTFAALCAFCWFRQADIGNDVPKGWHGFPLRAWDRDGDIVSWHIMWRQAWYIAVIAQLTSMSPIILSAFVAGILQ